MPNKTKFKKNLLYGIYLFLIIVGSLEIILRIYYPFQRKIRGSKIELSTNITYRFTNDFNPRLDPLIINRRNSLGFRGENPGPDIKEKLSILTIGGSTTACTFLTEGRTWTDLLGKKLLRDYPKIWVNNAGLDGISSFGSLNFLYYYLPGLSFKPKVALFLLGANDVDRHDLSGIDSSLNNQVGYKTKKWLQDNSETINFLNDLKWEWFPKNIFTDKQNWDFTHFQSVYLSNETIQRALEEQASILPAFRQRLYAIVELCRKDSIKPVFITQPLLFGDGTPNGGNPTLDYYPITKTQNGQLFWLKLILYNEVIKEVAAEKQVPCIELATRLPKDTAYYYDMLHFTNQGAEKVSDIIYDGLNNYLAKEFKEFKISE